MLPTPLPFCTVLQAAHQAGHRPHLPRDLRHDRLRAGHDDGGARHLQQLVQEQDGALGRQGRALRAPRVGRRRDATGRF